MKSPRYNGLNLLEPGITEVELADLDELNRRTKGYTPASHEFWLNHDPDVFKAMLLAVQAADPTASDTSFNLRNVLAALHYYVAIGYQEGIAYQTRTAMDIGATKGLVLDTLSVAYMVGHARGMNVAAEVVGPILDNWHAPEDASALFPPSWAYGPDAFRSGVDFSTVDLTADEANLIRTWHRLRTGGVPYYVEFLAQHRPQLLKAHRRRYENAIRHELPSEMLPYMLIYFHTATHSRAGLRENVALGLSLGLSVDDVISAVSRSLAAYGALESFPDIDDLLSSAKPTHHRSPKGGDMVRTTSGRS